jgi:hypothetical protein
MTKAASCCCSGRRGVEAVIRQQERVRMVVERAFVVLSVRVPSIGVDVYQW